MVDLKSLKNPASAHLALTETCLESIELRSSYPNSDKVFLCPIKKIVTLANIPPSQTRLSWDRFFATERNSKGKCEKCDKAHPGL